jgi:hypothetical protein
MKTIPTPFIIAAVFTCGLGALLAAEIKQPKEVAAMLADYNREYAKAKEPGDKILRAEGSKTVGRLVREDRAEEARLVRTQVEDKLAGKAVTDVHSELTTLFERYDNSVASAILPVREKYVKRVNTLIKNFEGKDMNAILTLSDAKKEIEGIAETQSPSGAAPTPTSSESLANKTTSDLPQLDSRLGVEEMTRALRTSAQRIPDQAEVPGSNDKLTIVQAVYGADGAWRDVTPVIQKMVQNNSLSVHIQQPYHEIGGDPAYGKSKHLLIGYRHKGKANVATVKEQNPPVGLQLTLP